MGLVKCPDCGKMVSERVEACPNCGCPREYFETCSDNIVETKSVDEQHIDSVTDNNYVQLSDSLLFKIAGEDVVCKKGNNMQFAKRFGEYLDDSKDARVDVVHLYMNNKTVEGILADIPELAAAYMDDSIDDAIELLFAFGISMSEDQFIEKYYFTHNMDFGYYYEQIVDKYSNIMQLKSQMEQYRRIKEQSHGRWVGGGFGLRGALKGAITASILNGVSDIIHSDSTGRLKDKKEIQERLENLYQYSMDFFVYALENCVLNVYLAVKDELVEQGLIDEKQFVLDREQADILFENTLKYSNDSTRKIKEIIRCIQLFPGEKRYYDEILEEIYDGIQNDGESFFEYMKYWGLDFFPVPDNPEQEKIYSARFIERIKQLIGRESTNIFADINIISVDSLSANTRRKLFHKIALFYYGAFIIYKSDDIILTDYLLWIDGEVIYLRDMLGIEFEKCENGIITLKYVADEEEYDEEDDDDEEEIEPAITDYACLKKLIVVANYGIEYSEFEGQFLSLKKDYFYEDKIKGYDLPEKITDIDSYLLYRRCAEIAMMDIENMPDGSSFCYKKVISELCNIDCQTRKNLITNTRFYEWIGSDCTLEKIMKSIELEKMFRFAPKDIWTDLVQDGEKPTSYQQADSNLVGKIIISMQGRNLLTGKAEGFAITDESKIKCYGSDTYFDAENVTTISKYNSSQIDINDGIKVGHVNLTEADEISACYITALLKLYCIRIASNDVLWCEGWGEKPKPRIKIDNSEFENKIKEYAKAHGFSEILIKERTDNLSNKQLQKKLQFQISTNPSQKLLYFRDKLYVSDQIIGIDIYCGRVSDVTGIEYNPVEYDEKTLLLHLSNGSTMKLKLPEAEPEILNAINYALDYQNYQKTDEALRASGYVKQISKKLAEEYAIDKMVVKKSHVKFDYKHDGYLFLLPDRFLFKYDDKDEKIEIFMNTIKSVEYRKKTLFIQTKGKLLYTVFDELQNGEKWLNLLQKKSEGGYSLIQGFENRLNTDRKESVTCFDTNQEDKNVGEGDNIDIEAYIKANFTENDKVRAISYYRESTGADLKTAKDTVDSIFSGKNISTGIAENDVNDDIKNDKNMMFCPFCGNKIERTAKFCNYCGKENAYKSNQ